MPRSGSTLIALALITLMTASCGDDDPAAPGGAATHFLAGGGRQASNDDFNGGPDEIAQKIQEEMTFPGQIKVTVIREKRAVNIAR